MNESCNFCGNKNFQDKNIQYIYRRSEQFLIANDVPCVQCEYCGEQYFRADILKKIEKEVNEIYSLKKKIKREISVPVEHYIELQPA
ncbi:MAG: YgiT-type zinc finger protein [Desulfobacterales bacterium]|nr:YgiT-type zinc finger protein [Desulfobacterales bacterium]